MPRISIAMATYNGAQFLREQLGSFAEQTLLPNELVVCDDGSSDSTLEILEDFASDAPFCVRVVRNATRLGFNKNFEKAIGICSGEIVFVSDQDDRWYPEKIATVAKVFSENPTFYSVTNDHELVDTNGKSIGRTVLQNIRSQGYSDDLFGPGCCTALRRPVLRLLLPFPEKAQYDYWLGYIPALLNSRILVDTPLQTYRRHPSNTLDTVIFYSRHPSFSAVMRWTRNGATVRKDFEERIRAIDALSEALLARSPLVAHLGLEYRLPGALASLEAERSDYEHRLACLAKPRLQRAPAILKLLKSGSYDRFRGWKSAIKDLAT